MKLTSILYVLIVLTIDVIFTILYLSTYTHRSILIKHPEYNAYQAMLQKNASLKNISRYDQLLYSNSSIPFKVREQSSLFISKENASRFSSLEEIHTIIWKQIEELQENGNCEEKKYLHCEAMNWAGLGSLVHRYGSCMQVAFALGRTFFIHQREYDHFGGLSQWLLPESKKCGHMKDLYYTYKDKCNVHDSKCYLNNSYEIDNSHKVFVYYPHHGFPAPRRVPGTIPKVLEAALKRLNVDDPKMWFAGQFIGYLLLRPNKSFYKQYLNISRQINIEYPYLAMHIRHGDKLTSKEAKYIPEINFVKKAESYFNKNGNFGKRTIYLATDDNTIKEKLNTLLPNVYNIIRCPESYRYKGLKSYDDKYFPKEVIGTMLTDLYFLVHSNFTICTYSSNIGRLINLLKQATSPYSTKNAIVSLDDGNVMSYQMRGYVGYSKLIKSFYFAIRKNTITGTINGVPLLSYSAGREFKKKGTSISKDFVSVAYQSETALVFAMDVIEWPGYPSYYFYEI